MRLDPQARALLPELNGTPPPEATASFLAEARTGYERSRRRLSGTPPAVASSVDLEAAGGAGTVRVRYYRPYGSAPAQVLPALVYFHGGGWVFGNLESHDTVCRQLANAVEAGVLAVDYRLAPEWKFPAAMEDAVAATRWIRAHAERLHLDQSRVAVAGDSAGGNLAAATALQLRDDGDPPLAMQVLVYPALDFGFASESHRRFGEGYALTLADLLWHRAQYLRSDEDIADWRASPLRAGRFGGLAPAYVITAGFDPLRAEGQAYAAALEGAGVPVSYECFEGMIHGFLVMGGRIAAAGHAVYRIAQQLRPLLRRGAQ